MKNVKYILVLAITFSFLTVNAQEKKIQFNKGTLKICSSKNFIISGYDGSEVIITSLNENKVVVYGERRDVRFGSKEDLNQNLKFSTELKDKSFITPSEFLSNKITDSVISVRNVTTARLGFFNKDGNRREGLKKLGKKNENADLGIYFTIEQKEGELIFKDNTEGQLVMLNTEKYEIMIPNSLRLLWKTNGCGDKNNKSSQYVFLNSNTSSLSNFNGEVEISTSLSNMKLTDVTGPVSINSIGGNVTVEFDKKTPKKLYSIYSNNGFIDITLPTNSDIIVDANSSSIFSDIDFNVLEDTEEEGLQKMKLKLKSGKVKMKLNAGLGNIYLRKK